MEQLEEYFFKKNTRYVLWGLGALLVALLIFHAGYVSGRESAEHGPHGAFFAAFPPFGGMDLPQGFIEKGHGAIGTVESVALPKMVVQSKSGMSENVYVGSTTIIKADPAVGTTTLAPGEFIIVIGDPDDTDDQGMIDARLIRLLPPPPPLSGSSTMHMQVIELHR